MSLVPRPLILLLLLGTAVAPAGGDTVKLRGRPAFQNVRIHGFQRGRVVFRGVSGQDLRQPLSDVEWLSVSGHDELNAAELARAAGDSAAACAAYESALAKPGAPWLADLVRFRLVDVADQAGQFDQAVAAYVQLLVSATESGPIPGPRRPGLPGSATNSRALGNLERTLDSDPPAAVAGPLRTLLLEVALCDDLDPLPAQVAPLPGGWPGDSGKAPVVGSRPARHPATLPAEPREPGPGSAPAAPLGILPPLEEEPARPATASATATLGRESLVLAVADAACTGGDPARGARLVRRALPFVAAAERGRWRIVFGRCRIELGEYGAAAADLIQVAHEDRDPRVGGEALYYAGYAHERLGRPEIARGLYSEVLEREGAAEDTRAAARHGLERLPR